MKAEAAEFVEEMLRKIRTDFFGNAPDKHFWQQKRELERAITYPARWLKDHGGQWQIVELSRQALTTVLAAIKTHGNPKIERFSIYLLECVQKRMRFHGEEYLQKAKQMPAAGRFVKGAIAELKSAAAGADPGAVLAETNRILGRGRRRIRKGKDVDLADDLFSSCKGAATPARTTEKFRKPLQHRPRGAQTPQTGSIAAADS